jgi:hypothetical protein
MNISNIEGILQCLFWDADQGLNSMASNLVRRYRIYDECAMLGCPNKKIIKYCYSQKRLLADLLRLSVNFN